MAPGVSSTRVPWRNRRWPLALVGHQRRSGGVSTACLERGATFLRRCLPLAPAAYEALWLGKDLYCPQSVVRATLLGALAAYETCPGQR
jgi:hypothetical protein